MLRFINKNIYPLHRFLAAILFLFSSQFALAQKIFHVSFEQAPLPYAYDALEDAIDTRTMEIHYSKHAAAYCKNLNEAAAAESVDKSKSLESLLESISKYSVKMRNNAGGHYNHEIFWQMMRKPSLDNSPKGKLAEVINESFGSFEKMKQQFSDVAKGRFGSGWAWLYMNQEGKLQIGSTANQDNPLMDVCEIRGWPLLCLDVWEHAYYLKYQNKRADYIENWWRAVNWDYVEQRRMEDISHRLQGKLN